MMAGTSGAVMVPDSVTTTLAPGGTAPTSTIGRSPAAACASSAQQASGTSTTNTEASSNQSRAGSMEGVYWRQFTVSATIEAGV